MPETQRFRRWFRFRTVGLLTLAVGVCARRAAHADLIVMTNGREVIGSVERRDTEGARVWVRTSGGVIPIPEANIERIVEQDAATDALALADQAIAAGDVERARALLESALVTGDDARVRERLREVRGMLEEGNDEQFGAIVREVEQLLAAGEFARASAMAQDRAARDGTRAAARERLVRLAAHAELELGRRAVDRVNYSLAEQHYREAVRLSPGDPHILLEMAELLSRVPAREAQALPLYEEGIERARATDPPALESAELLAHLDRAAAVARRQDRPDLAAQFYLTQAALDTTGRYAAALDRAIEAFRQDARLPDPDKRSRIIDELESVVERHPGHEGSLVLLGLLQFEQGNWRRAAETLEQVVGPETDLARQPERGEALYRLAISRRRLGMLEPAAACLTSLIRQGAGSYDVLRELGEIRLRQEELDQAEDLLRQAIARDAAKLRAHRSLGHVYAKMGNHAEARKCYQEVLRRQPNDIDAHLLIAQTWFWEENFQMTIQAADEVIALLEAGADAATTTTARRVAEMHMLAGEAHLKLQEAFLARDRFERALATGVQPGVALDGIGRSFQAQGLHERSQQSFREAIAAEPDRPDAYLSLAISYHRYLRQPEEAIRNYLAYLEHGGQNPNVRRWIAELGGTPPPEAAVTQHIPQDGATSFTEYLQ